MKQQRVVLNAVVKNPKSKAFALKMYLTGKGAIVSYG